ncbi:hypothetical protein K5M33_10605 [Chromobacterium vaccinii]|nr:hypothetical protein [Chromobacterium vaccinii]MBX9357171.1 hypothetical protein [Chromobacterium vaccinii]
MAIWTCGGALHAIHQTGMQWETLLYGGLAGLLLGCVMTFVLAGFIWLVTLPYHR